MPFDFLGSSSLFFQFEEGDARRVADRGVLACESEAPCGAIHAEDGDVVAPLVATVEKLAVMFLFAFIKITEGLTEPVKSPDQLANVALKGLTAVKVTLSTSKYLLLVRLGDFVTEPPFVAATVKV